MGEEHSVSAMAQVLSGISEEVWGRYAFSRDPLGGKIGEKQKAEYSKAAFCCGREWAARMSEKYGTRDPKELARRMGVKTEIQEMPLWRGRMILARFDRPGQITIYTDSIRRAAELAGESGCGLLREDRLFVILLAHELFHAVEERSADEIYTRTERVRIRGILFSKRSPLPCLSEMGAMAFARELLELE